MARTQAPHSATAQFFINVVDNDFLNFSGESLQGWGYCVFAEVVDGNEQKFDVLHNFLPFFLIADGKIRYQQFHFSSVSSQSATVKWHFDYSWRF